MKPTVASTTEIRVKCVTVSGHARATSERSARSYAETIVETDWMMVHTIMHADGSGIVITHRKIDGAWVPAGVVRFDPNQPTRFNRPIHTGHAPADNYLDT